MSDGLMRWGKGEGVEFYPDGKAVVTLVLDADGAAWLADSLPRRDVMADNFAIIADRLRGGR